MAAKALSDVLTQETLGSLAYGESFGRGKRYFEQGRVKALKESDGVATARVRGSHWYDVELRAEPVGLRGRCSCPVGQDGLFCKHCVAAGIAWIADNALAADEHKGAGSPEAMREYLVGLGKQKLVDMLMAQARTDSGLRQRLALAVARSRPAGPDLDAIRLAIDDATGIGEPWSERRYANRVEKLNAVLDTLRDLLKTSQARAVAELAALGLARSDSMVGRVYDPGCEVRRVVDEFVSLHTEACAESGQDPEELAKWLFEFELGSDNAKHERIYTCYVELLGEKGLAAYRKLAEAEWRAKGATSGEPATAAVSRLREIVRHAALMTVDPDLMAEVGNQVAGSSWEYFFAARECMEADQPEKALAWAEAGVKAFPAGPNSGLRELLIEEYMRQNRLTDALNQAWALFTEQSSIDTYMRLRGLARKAGQAAVWRDEALEYLRERSVRGPKVGATGEDGEERLFCGSLLVDILLGEKNVDAAWREAQAGGCGAQTWFKLARARQATHPADAIRVYQRLAEEAVQGANNESYRAAVRCLRRAKDVIAKLGQTQKFREYLVSFRDRHKRKKNLLWLLEREFGPGDA